MIGAKISHHFSIFIYLRYSLLGNTAPPGGGNRRLLSLNLDGVAEEDENVLVLTGGSIHPSYMDERIPC